MRKKFMLVSKLAEQTARQAASSVERWKSYLDTACRVYKYGFEDQLLIFAQKPEVAACAERSSLFLSLPILSLFQVSCLLCF